MISYDTKAEVLERLDRLTRDLDADNIRTFTTANIASECHVSRSLASQYLNELVRQGLAIKVNARPVIFLHRHAAERFFRRLMGYSATLKRIMLSIKYCFWTRLTMCLYAAIRKTGASTRWRTATICR